eukprot:CAMPEP_0172902874 /NCGR_PEP_ID=MMETSP1075-20121228/169295_1 /TAXON_ID=2916 /ORGANISM="Ceratium fusus, Strain PA161109" /LENGTH=645 /DNA_ID=CAMNT_0013759563 /DNA_START=45 /DNA_END=1982 /DNA_ORIENTATION=+
MKMRDDDVVMCSLGKAGTTWVHKILFLLLHGLDEQGNSIDATEGGVNANGQTYPEGLPLQRGMPAPTDADAAQIEERRRKFFGEWAWPDLEGQSSPRLFSTHLFGQFLPAQLLAQEGTGKLIVVLRNLKDVLASLHFFQGEAKDGWHGNEHGPGSLARFIADDCPNAYGSSFTWISEMDKVVEALQPTGRVCVVYYEALQLGLPMQVKRLAAFLGVSLSQAKLDALTAAVSFNKMKAAPGKASLMLRKGGIGDWMNHLDEASWARFDAAFDLALEKSRLAEPFRFFQASQVSGLPPPKHEWTSAVDPREWSSFTRATLEDGLVVRDGLIVRKASNPSFVRPTSEFLGVVQPPGTTSALFEAEPGRYHLFVAGVCPWASGVRAIRTLLGLEEVVSMDVADGQSSAGWVFLEGATCNPWAGRDGPFFIHEAYQAHDSTVTTRLTVPVLWDQKLNKIVSNDSWALTKMFATAFAPLGNNKGLSLLPPLLADEIEKTQSRIYQGLLNGVYRSGIARYMGNAEGAAAAATEVYAALDNVEAQLQNSRFLLTSDAPTVVDVRLAMTTFRYDASYRYAFGLSGGKGSILSPDSGYPNLQGHARDMYGHLGGDVDWQAFRQYYRWAGQGFKGPLPCLEELASYAAAPHARRTP